MTGEGKSARLIDAVGKSHGFDGATDGFTMRRSSLYAMACIFGLKPGNPCGTSATSLNLLLPCGGLNLAYCIVLGLSFCHQDRTLHSFLPYFVVLCCCIMVLCPSGITTV